MRKLLVVFLICIPFITHTQDYKFKGRIHDGNNRYIYLYSLYGDQIRLIDSTKTTAYGQFQFNLKQDLPKGLYRLGITEKNHLDIILNKESIDLSTHISDPFNKLIFNESKENKIYLGYIQKRNYDQYRIELLQPVISYYPITDPFFPTLLMELSNIQDSLDQYIDKIIKDHAHTFASKLIAIDRRPALDPMQNQIEQKTFAKQHFFDGKDFSDTTLLQSNVLSSTILSYLSLYQNNEFSKAQMEDEFIKAVDVILPAMRKNQKIYEFVIEYLIGGFDQFGLTKVMTHIASRSIVDDSCKNEDLKHRIETLKKLAPGNKAPEINIGNTKLSAINKKFTLVVFYASWCPHCSDLLSELKTYYNDHKKGLEVFSISIDTSLVDYQNYLKRYHFEWVDACDFRGWDTQSAIDYGVYVTPNLFLLDENKVVIARPSGMPELKQLIKWLPATGQHID
jgi:thiol-disulfide isomerase/thioredoxin